MEFQFSLRSIVQSFMQCLISFSILFTIGLTLYIKKYFDYVTIDQALSTLYFGLDGAFSGDSIFYKRFIKWCIQAPLLVTVLLFIINKIQISLKQTSSNLLRTIITIVFVPLHPIVLLVLAVLLFANQFQLRNYLNSKLDSDLDYFGINYKDPKTIPLQIRNPKSLILIYVESLEKAYGDKETFGRDLLKPLNPWQTNGFSFDTYRQMQGTGWTIAGIVATQCGLPLKQLTIFNGNRFGENINHFLPSATCLSDVLDSYGYQNIFLSGATSRIGGKILFLRDHHYHEIYDKEKWLQLGTPETEMTAWGLSDDELFKHARKILSHQMTRKKLFNLTILTADTHGDKGQLSHYCQQKGNRGFAGIVECTAGSISEFLSFIMQNHWEDKLNIVIIGDHLVMKNTLSNKLDTLSNRTMYNLFLTKQHFYKRTEDINPFNLLPTLLRLSGFEFQGKLGLGHAVISTKKHDPLPADSDIMEDKLNWYSASYAKLWLG